MITVQSNISFPWNNIDNHRGNVQKMSFNLSFYYNFVKELFISCKGNVNTFDLNEILKNSNEIMLLYYIN
jgi:hypothetical protein